MNINARQLVAECSAIASQPGELCEYLGKTRHKSKALKMVCAANGVEYPELLDRKWGTTAVTGRMLAVDWWKRQLKTANARLRESEQINNLHSRVQQLKKSKNRKEKLKIGYRYVSAGTLANHRETQRRLKDFLEAVQAVCDNGDIMPLKRIAAASVSNPVCRQAELICRLKGFEEWGIEHDMKCLFITLTCPSKYHAASAKYNRETPRQAQRYLCKVWARFRAWLKRQELEMHGFRMAEPHKDGTPHWHLVLWFRNGFEALVIQNKMRQMFLGEMHPEGDRMERGASVRRVKTEILAKDETTGKGGVLAYVLPYILKNITGVYSDGKTTFQDKHTNLSSNAVAERAIAYASLWRIRQFQQIGGPSVTVWRELRKIRGADAVEALPDIVKPLHQAADSNNWAAFIAAAEGQDVALWTETSADMVERLELEFGDFDAIPHNRLLPCLNAWGEPDVRRTLGVYVSGVKVKTRLHKWRIEWKRGEAAPHVPAFGTKLEIVLSRTFEELTAERRKHRQEVEETIHNAKRGAFAFQGQSPPLDLWQ